MTRRRGPTGHSKGSLIGVTDQRFIRVRLLVDHPTRTLYILASPDVVVPSGIILFSFFQEIPGRKDARAPEKLL